MYSDNFYKQRGIEREPIIADKIYDFLKSKNLTVKMRKASLNENMHDKIDYIYECSKDESFAKNEKVNTIKVDVKAGKTFTLYDNLGNNTLKDAKSTFIVCELDQKHDYLLWINTEKFKECVKIRPPKTKDSKYNKSKYFFIEDYIIRNKDFFGKHVKYL